MSTPIQNANADFLRDMNALNAAATQARRSANVLMALAGEAEPPTEPPIEPPVTPPPDAGWLEFPWAADSRVYYVASAGRAGATGESNDPFATLSDAYARIRDGHPDRILLRRGDTFDNAFAGDAWRKSGRSAAEPIVLGAYGDPSKPRPVIRCTGSGIEMVNRGDDRKHIVVDGVEFRGSGKGYGVSIASETADDITLQDVRVTGFEHGIAMQFGGSFRLNRCVVDSNGGQSHSQGLFANQLDRIEITGCSFIGNGSPTIFSQTVYIQRSVRELVFTDNFVEGGDSSHGIQARNGGIVDRNVFYRCACGIMYGNEGDESKNELPVRGSVNDNYLFECDDISDDARRGWALQIQNADGVFCRRNIVGSHASNNQRPRGLMLYNNRETKNSDLLVEGNLIAGAGQAFEIKAKNAGDGIVIENNVFSDSGDYGSEFSEIPGVRYTSNRRGKNVATAPRLENYRRPSDLVAEMVGQHRGNRDKLLHAPAIIAWAKGEAGQ